MNILWITNLELPVVSDALGRPRLPFGGWLDLLSRRLLSEGHRLTVLFPSGEPLAGVDDLLTFSSFPDGNCREAVLCALDGNPDVIHLFGTEFPHTLTAVKLCRERGVLSRTHISIQGLPTVYALHYTLGLPARVVRRFTLRDLLRRDSIALQARKMARSGETEALRTVPNIIGRTEWDRAIAEQVHPGAAYRHCDEILRGDFYPPADRSAVVPHTVFVSQWYAPLKGLHILLSAMPEILRRYPDARIITTGEDPMRLSPRRRLLISSYTAYLRSLIRRYRLDGKITFLGTLSAEQMREQYLRAEVFVSPSTIENSPNSVCEAMLSGCPVVSSFVGGLQSLISHGKTGLLYQADAPYMLADLVCRVFADPAAAAVRAAAARETALARHDPETVTGQYLAAYASSLKTEAGGSV